MALSRPARDRITAAVGAFILIFGIFGVLFTAKACGRRRTVTFYDGEQVVKKITVEKDDMLEEWTPEPSDDREFDCWVYEDGRKFNFSTRITENISLYATWKYGPETENS